MFEYKGKINNENKIRIIEEEIRKELETNPIEDERVAKNLTIRIGVLEDGQVAYEAILNKDGKATRVVFENSPFNDFNEEIDEFCGRIDLVDFDNPKAALDTRRIEKTRTIYAEGEFVRGSENLKDGISLKVEQYIRKELSRKPFAEGITDTLEIKVGYDEKRKIVYAEATKEKGEERVIVSHTEFGFLKVNKDFDVDIEVGVLAFLGAIENRLGPDRFLDGSSRPFERKEETTNYEKTIFENGHLTRYVPDKELEAKYGRYSDVEVSGLRTGYARGIEYNNKEKYKVIEETVRRKTATYEFKSDTLAQNLKIEVGKNEKEELCLVGKVKYEGEYKTFAYISISFDGAVKSWINEKVSELVQECDVTYEVACERAEKYGDIYLENREERTLFRDGEPTSGVYEKWNGEKHVYVNKWEHKSIDEVFSENKIKIDEPITYEITPERIKDDVKKQVLDTLREYPIENEAAGKTRIAIAEIPSTINPDEKRLVLVAHTNDLKVIAYELLSEINKGMLKGDVIDFLEQIHDDHKSIDDKDRDIRQKYDIDAIISTEEFYSDIEKQDDTGENNTENHNDNEE